jgi:hypothetical protein
MMETDPQPTSPLMGLSGVQVLLPQLSPAPQLMRVLKETSHRGRGSR